MKPQSVIIQLKNTEQQLSTGLLIVPFEVALTELLGSTDHFTLLWTSYPASQWKWGWGWPWFDTNFLPFLMEIMLKKH